MKPVEEVSADSGERRRGRRQLLLLAAVFFVPLALAFTLYYGPGGWRPHGGTHQGDLIDPAVPLPDVTLERPGSAVRTGADFLRGQWTIAYLGPGDCDQRCRRALYLSRQSRIALHRDIERVKRVFLATHPCCAARRELAAEHPDLQIAIIGDDSDSRALLAAIPALEGEPPVTAGRLYVIDPLGNLVLSYSPRSADKALLSDLRRLLRLSHIG